MKIRFVLVCASLAILAPLLVLRANSSRQRMIESDVVGDYSEWHPTSAEIEAQLINRPANVNSDKKADTFVDMFKQRFRSHDIAISVRRLAPDKFKLMCAATIPRYEMSRMAVDLGNEAFKILGHHVDIDIFETYISATNRKLAELRWRAKTNMGTLVFDPKFTRQEPESIETDY